MVISECIRKKISIKTIVEKSGYDEWFIREIAGIVETESSIKKMSIDTYLKAKSEGFSDEKIIELSNFTKRIKSSKR